MEPISIEELTNDSLKPLMMAAVGGWLPIVRELLTHNELDVNAKTVYGLTAMMIAACRGDISIFRELLNDRRVDVNAKNNE